MFDLFIVFCYLGKATYPSEYSIVLMTAGKFNKVIIAVFVCITQGRNKPYCKVIFKKW